MADPLLDMGLRISVCCRRRTHYGALEPLSFLARSMRSSRSGSAKDMIVCVHLQYHSLVFTSLRDGLDEAALSKTYNGID